MTDPEATISDLRARLRDLPPEDTRTRAEWETTLGSLLAERVLAHGISGCDPAELDEAIGALERGDGAPKTLLRVALLRFLRYYAHGGDREDVNQAIARLRILLADPGPYETKASALLAYLLLLRVFPDTLRADTAKDFASVFAAMRGFQFNIARASADLTESSQIFEKVSLLPDTPEEIRTIAHRLSLIRKLATGDQTSLLQVVGQIVQASGSPGTPPMPALDLKAIESWLELTELQSNPNTAADDAVIRARELLDELPAAHPMHAPIGYGLGKIAIDRDAQMADLLQILTRSMEQTEGDHPFAGLLREMLAGATSVVAVEDPLRENGAGPTLAEAVEVTTGLLEESKARAAETGADEDVREAARHSFMAGLSLVMSSIGSGDPETRRAGLQLLGETLERLPRDDGFSAIALAAYGSVLFEQSMTRGTLQEEEAADLFLEQSQGLLAHFPESDQYAQVIRGMTIILRHRDLRGPQDADRLSEGIGDLTALVERLEGHSTRVFLLVGLAFLHLQHALITGDMTEFSLGLDYAIEAGDQDTGSSTRHLFTALSALARMLRFLMDGDLNAIDRLIPRLERTITNPTFGVHHRPPLMSMLALAYAQRHTARGDAADLDKAIDWYRAADESSADLTEGRSAEPLFRLAQALRLRGDSADAVREGLRALRARAREVLLQIGPDHGLTRARDGDGFAWTVALWSLEDGRPDLAVEALELGRGLVLHSATTFTSIPDSLRAAGRDDLAAVWAERAPGVLEIDSVGPEAAHSFLRQIIGGETPSDLYRRVLAVLDDRPEAGGLLAVPTPAEIGAAAAATGAHAFVYLLPGQDGGWAIVLDREGVPRPLRLPALAERSLGPVRALAGLTADDPEARPEQRTAVAEVCDWAWSSAMEQVLDICASITPEGETPRVVLVPCGVLGLVPWHAARRRLAEKTRYVCEDAVLSYSVSGRQLMNGVRTKRREHLGRPVLIADPGHGGFGLPWASREAEALSMSFYPDAEIFGITGQPASAENVRAALGRARLLHCASHARSAPSPRKSAILLAGEDVLPVAEALTSQDRLTCELMVLSACVSDLAGADYDESLTLATAFLTAGVAEVVGSRWEVLDRAAALLMYMFHLNLSTGLDAADALRAAQRWMLDPDRKAPERLPKTLQAVLTRFSGTLAEPSAWAAFTHQGVASRRP
ncbi:CHAT domain-containing protein [Actinocorallia sp. B10E7]|uniref:CHAT domain-containing protein n=1 Tax=Actinocorallia sp. B10E7 TaxID=3153558 RepID=UPI00325E7C2A